MRAEIRREVASIEPLDELEQTFQTEVLRWIDSGAELYRREKPDELKEHLKSWTSKELDIQQIQSFGHPTKSKLLDVQLFGARIEPGEPVAVVWRLVL